MKVARKIKLLFFVLVFLLSRCRNSKADKKTQEDEKTQEIDGNIAIETVKTDHFTMEYCKFGHGKKTLVVLPGLSIQSVMESANAISETYQLLVDEYTIYVFERRQELPPSYSVFDMAQDTVVAFQTIDLEKISLFGASYGGMAAMIIAVQHPELIEKIVLASSTAVVTEEEYKTVDNWVRLAKEKDAERLYLAFGEVVYPKEVYEQSKELLVDTAKAVTEDDLRRFIILAEGVKGFDIRKELDKIQCPVLAIVDKEDHVLGASATKSICRYMNQRSDFELYMYEGYGHALYDLATDFKERMLRFLQKDKR